MYKTIKSSLHKIQSALHKKGIMKSTSVADFKQ